MRANRHATVACRANRGTQHRGIARMETNRDVGRRNASQKGGVVAK